MQHGYEKKLEEIKRNLEKQKEEVKLTAALEAEQARLEAEQRVWLRNIVANFMTVVSFIFVHAFEFHALVSFSRLVNIYIMKQKQLKYNWGKIWMLRLNSI